MKETLTYEQSKYLIELGISKEKASIKEDENGPALFTLVDLFKLLPKELHIKNEELEDDCPLQIEVDKTIATTYYGTFTEMPRGAGSCWIGSKAFYKEELIDSFYELLIWCIKNEHWG